MRIRFSGRAGTYFRRLPEQVRGDFRQASAELQKRFEPENRKKLYRAELRTLTKRRNEDWPVYGKSLEKLADKELQEEARERFALNQYLTQLTNPQVAFGVKAV